MNYNLLWKLGFLLLLAIQTLTVSAQNWPQWRGPSRDGAIVNFKTPVLWPDDLKLLWKTPVGGGISSPVVANGKAWTHTRQGEQEVVSSIDLTTGKIIWTKSYAAPFKPNPPAAKLGNGPFATPLVHQDKLYTFGITGILSCFDANSGQLKWQKNFGEVNTNQIFCGTAASPVVDQKNLIVQAGDDLRGAIYAFDLESGEEKWKWSGENVAYASPIISQFDQVRQIVAHTNDAMVGIDADSGKLLWKEPFPETKWRENIVTPLQHQNLIITSNGAQGTTAFQISKADTQWKVKKVWQNTDVAMYMSTPVIIGDYLFGMSSKRKGMFFCVKAATGEVLWKTKGDEGENAVILRSQDAIFFLTELGNLKVIKNNKDQYQQLASYQVSDSSTWAHPVIWQNRILVKDKDSILLWGF